MPVLPEYVKDPSAVLDYSYDWSLWLQESEVISSASWTVPPGINKQSEDNSTTLSTVWLSGGTAGTDYTVTCQVTTNQGRTDQRSITIRCRER